MGSSCWVTRRGGIVHRSLFYQTVSEENIFLAWRKFARGKRGKPDVQQFELNLERNLFALCNELQNGTWRHSPYRQFVVNDPKRRIIHKATVADRIVHQAVVNILEPLFEPTFLPQAWSCRVGKGVAAAIDNIHERLEKASRYGSRDVWVLQCDIRKFFASVDRFLLYGLIVRKIPDKQMQNLICEILDSHSPGLPLGNVTSQLFANIVLTPLDRFVIEEIQPIGYARYCDDVILLSRDESLLHGIAERIAECCIDTLHMELHPAKTTIRRYSSGIDWLGVRLFPGGARRMRVATRKRAWKRIDEAVRNLHEGNIDDDYWRSVVASYDGVFRRGFASGDGETVGIMRKTV